jgi:AraC family transcriptional regulator
MNVQLVQIDPIKVVMLRHTGPYDQIGPKFDQLWQWSKSQSIPSGRVLGLYGDNPDYVEASLLRSAACVEVPEGYQITDPNGLSLEAGAIAGGSYATTRYVGPYEEMTAVWSRFTQQIEGSLGKEISDRPAFEVYVNDPAETPASELVTDLYMPLL